MKRGSFGAWLAVALGVIYFLAPLIATFEFSLRLKRGEYSFEAYRLVFASGNFQSSFLYSAILALVTIVLGVMARGADRYWVQLRLPRLRALVEFITLLPLVIPAIVLVFGYIRLYDSSSWLPLTGSGFGTDVLLTLGYVALADALYVSLDRYGPACDRRAHAHRGRREPGRDLAGSFCCASSCPNIRSAILSGAFLTFAIVIGEFTFASLLNRPAFGPYLQLVGRRAPMSRPLWRSWPSRSPGLAWGLIQVIGQGARGSSAGTR